MAKEAAAGVQRVDVFGMRLKAVGSCGCPPNRSLFVHVHVWMGTAHLASVSQLMARLLWCSVPHLWRPCASTLTAGPAAYFLAFPPASAPCQVTQDGQRLAYSGGAAIKPGGVQGYLSRAFKGRLDDAKVGGGQGNNQSCETSQSAAAWVRPRLTLCAQCRTRNASEAVVAKAEAS